MAQFKVYHPLLVAAWVHHQSVQIHPFADGSNLDPPVAFTVRMQRHSVPKAMKTPATDVRISTKAPLDTPPAVLQSVATTRHC